MSVGLDQLRAAIVTRLTGDTGSGGLFNTASSAYLHGLHEEVAPDTGHAPTRIVFRVFDISGDTYTVQATDVIAEFVIEVRANRNLRDTGFNKADAIANRLRVRLAGHTATMTVDSATWVFSAFQRVQGSQNSVPDSNAEFVRRVERYRTTMSVGSTALATGASFSIIDSAITGAYAEANPGYLATQPSGVRLRRTARVHDVTPRGQDDRVFSSGKRMTTLEVPGNVVLGQEPGIPITVASNGLVLLGSTGGVVWSGFATQEIAAQTGVGAVRAETSNILFLNGDVQ